MFRTNTHISLHFSRLCLRVSVCVCVSVSQNKNESYRVQTCSRFSSWVSLVAEFYIVGSFSIEYFRWTRGRENEAQRTQNKLQCESSRLLAVNKLPDSRKNRKHQAKWFCRRQQRHEKVIQLNFVGWVRCVYDVCMWPKSIVPFDWFHWKQRPRKRKIKTTRIVQLKLTTRKELCDSSEDSKKKYIFLTFFSSFSKNETKFLTLFRSFSEWDSFRFFFLQEIKFAIALRVKFVFVVDTRKIASHIE